MVGLLFENAREFGLNGWIDLVHFLANRNDESLSWKSRSSACLSICDTRVLWQNGFLVVVMSVCLSVTSEYCRKFNVKTNRPVLVMSACAHISIDGTLMVGLLFENARELGLNGWMDLVHFLANRNDESLSWKSRSSACLSICDTRVLWQNGFLVVVMSVCLSVTSMYFLTDV